MVPTPSLPSANYTFSQLPNVSMPRCSIRRPSTYKTTLNAGLLYPVFLDEVLPGDTFKLDASIICRLTTPLVPFMDNLTLDFQFFFVPNRLVWKNWQEFCGEQDKPGVFKNYTLPFIHFNNGVEVGSIYDYFGLPTKKQFRDHDVQALPLRAYQLIWDEWYRDENIQDRVFNYDIGDGPDKQTDYKLLPRGKRKDYFTSALPWPQKGAAVSLSLTGNVPVVGNGQALKLAQGGYLGYDNGAYLCGALPGSTNPLDVSAGAPGTKITSHKSQLEGVATSDSGLIADMSNVTSVSITALRQAVALQRLLELDARGGTRYTEILRAHFGVTSPDARLQRPELLGSFSVPLYLHTVPQSSGTGTTSETPQGNLSAFGLANSSNRAFQKSFVEHGLILGLVSIRSDLTYQQGLPRMWSRSSRYDFYWPALSSLGEQSILNKELYCQGATVKDSDGNYVDDKVFGYQERWSEYKYGYSKITGQLRSTFDKSLDYWHLAQKFDELPTLSDAFIRENPPLERVLAVTDAPQFIFDAFYDLNCVRPMPLYCVPGLVNHF